MSIMKIVRYCTEFDLNTVITIHYAVAVTLVKTGVVLTEIECSVSTKGRCDKCETCLILKEAQDDLRSSVI